MPVGKIELDWTTLEAIARFYEFPSSVFLLPKEEWAKPRLSGTRLDSLLKDKQKLEAIKDICSEGDE